MAAACRPVLYVGGRLLRALASVEPRVLLKVTGIPVVTTLMARGRFRAVTGSIWGCPGCPGRWRRRRRRV
nr:hypothetical protein [Frankia sp. Cppng1_Ct_nod]